MRWATAVVAVLTVGCATQEPYKPPVPTIVSTTSTTVHVSVETTVSVAPTTSIVPPVQTTVLEGQCAQWLGDALDVGWPESELETIDYLIWRESRCEPDAFNPEDPRGGSHGLMQINGHWCRPNPSTGIMVGWLQEQHIISGCDGLYDPANNLHSALVIWLEYGYEPWGL